MANLIIYKDKNMLFVRLAKKETGNRNNTAACSLMEVRLKVNYLLERGSETRGSNCVSVYTL